MTFLVAAVLMAVPPQNDPGALGLFADLPIELESWSGGEGDVPLVNAGGRYRSWRASFDGTLQADDDAIPGTNVDFHDELDIEEYENITGITAWFGLSATGRLWFDWWDGTWEGDALLLTDITFAGTTYTGGSTVHTKMEWRALTGLYLIDIPVPTAGLVGLDLSVGAGFKYVRLHGKLSSTVPPIDESGTFRAPVPVVGGIARLTLGEYLSAELEVQGLHVESWESVASGTIYDVSLAVQGRYKMAFGGVGYRWFGIRLEDERADIDKVQIDILIEGFFVELGVSF